MLNRREDDLPGRRPTTTRQTDKLEAYPPTALSFPAFHVVNKIGENVLLAGVTMTSTTASTSTKKHAKPQVSRAWRRNRTSRINARLISPFQGSLGGGTANSPGLTPWPYSFRSFRALEDAESTWATGPQDSGPIIPHHLLQNTHGIIAKEHLN